MIHIVTALNTLPGAQSTATDQDLLGIARNDPGALQALYQKISHSVYGFALSITGNTHDAEDVLQETILTVYRKACDYKPQGKPMAWIFTIARNIALMKLREAGKTVALEAQHTEYGDAVDRIEAAEDKMILRAALNALSEEERQIVTLHATGMKNREIAQVMKLPVNTVLSKYHRSIHKMRIYCREEKGLRD